MYEHLEKLGKQPFLFVAADQCWSYQVVGKWLETRRVSFDIVLFFPVQIVCDSASSNSQKKKKKKIEHSCPWRQNIGWETLSIAGAKSACRFIFHRQIILIRENYGVTPHQIDIVFVRFCSDVSLPGSYAINSCLVVFVARMDRKYRASALQRVPHI